jgi:hypothetical protein
MTMEELDPAVALGVIVTIAVAGLAASAFGWMLFKAGQLSHPSPLIVSLTMLTGVALLGALIGHDTDAYNLAAVGLGALAGSLAVVYRSGPDHDHPDKPSPPEQGGDDARGDDSEG